MAEWLVVYRGAVLRKCEAPDKTTATERLKPDSSKGEMVKSRASWELDKPSTREELSGPQQKPHPKRPKRAGKSSAGQKAYFATLTPEQRRARTANALAGRLKRYQLQTKAQRLAGTAHLRTPEVFAKKRATIAKKRTPRQKWLETHYRGGTDSGAGESSRAGIGNPARSRT